MNFTDLSISEFVTVSGSVDCYYQWFGKYGASRFTMSVVLPFFTTRFHSSVYKHKFSISVLYTQKHNCPEKDPGKIFILNKIFGWFYIRLKQIDANPFLPLSGSYPYRVLIYQDIKDYKSIFGNRTLNIGMFWKACNHISIPSDF